MGPVRISAAESWTTSNSNLAEDNGLEELAQLADMSLLLLSIIQTWKSSPPGISRLFPNRRLDGVNMSVTTALT
jgi:hypothetical protein